VRSTACAELLLNGTGAPDPPTPLSPNTPELTVRPLTTLPDADLQSQTWRLCAIASGGRPTHTVVSKIVRMVKQALAPPAEKSAAPAKPLPDRELMFVRPVQRLAKIDTFAAGVCLLHVTDGEQAMRISQVCQTVAARCEEIRSRSKRGILGEGRPTKRTPEVVRLLAQAMAGRASSEPLESRAARQAGSSALGE
jgi:hypothetical protein